MLSAASSMFVTSGYEPRAFSTPLRQAPSFAAMASPMAWIPVSVGSRALAELDDHPGNCSDLNEFTGGGTFAPLSLHGLGTQREGKAGDDRRGEAVDPATFSIPFSTTHERFSKL